MISPFTNPSYLLPPLVAFVLSIGLAVFIWRTRPEKDLSIKLFIGMLISIGAWGLVLFGMRTSPDVERAVIWDRGMPAASLATFVFLYHFTHAYTKTRGQRAIIIIAYIGLATTAVLSPSTSLFVEHMRVEDYGYAPVVGVGSYIVILSFPLLTAAAIRNLIRRYRVSHSYEERNRLIYLVIGAVLIVTGSYLDVLTNLPPAVINTGIVFSILGTIAVLKYNLLDIQSIARKSLAYVITSSAIAVPYILVIFYLTRTIGLTRSPAWIHAIVIVLISILIRPLYSWSQRLVDRFFYRDRYDYLRALEKFTGQTQSITDLKKLCNTVVRLAGGAMHASSAYLLLPSEENRGFTIESSTCPNKSNSRVVLEGSGVAIKWLKHNSDIVSLGEFGNYPQLQCLSSAEKKKLEDIGAHLIVPVKTKQGQLSALLILGEKLSQQPFSHEDKQLLKALSGHIAMAISNALLYEQVKRSKRALRESEEKLRLIFDSMAEGVAVVDLSTNIIKVNKALPKIFGYDRGEELIGKSAFDLMVEGERDEARKIIEKVLKGKCVSTGEATGLKKDGTEFNIELSSAAIREPVSGIPTGLVTIIEDITKRKQLEEDKEQMENKAQIASRLASVGEMAAGIAHEINNPLTAILGFSHLLLRKNADEKVRQDLEAIYSAAARAAKVVENLLTFARHREPQKQYADVNDVVRKTLELRAYELKTSNIEVVTELAADLPKTMVDFHQIQEVFLNIVLNAEQAMTEANRGGKLRIKTEETNGCIRISFADNGPGIPIELLKKVFDPFFSLRRERGGTGLGLSVSHGIVTSHGGRIYAKSKPGKGATFFVELPVTTINMDENKPMRQELPQQVE